jgi:hypothetical protein
MYNIMHHNVVSPPLDHFAARVTLGPLVVVSVQLMAAVTSEEVQMPWECTLHHHSSVHVYLYLYVSILYDSIWYLFYMFPYYMILFDSICISIFICFHIVWFYVIRKDIYIEMFPYFMILCDSIWYPYLYDSILYDSRWF